MPHAPTTVPEIKPTEIRPPCPGCPDPDNASRVDSPCPGPERIPDLINSIPTPEVSVTEVTIRSIASPILNDIIYCPRTQNSIAK